MNEDNTIMIVNDALQKGGKERRMLELIKGLVKNEYKVVLVLLSDIIEYDIVDQLPIELVIIKRKYKFEYGAYKKLDYIIKRVKPTIVHSWGFVSSVYLSPLVKKHSIKFVNGIIADSVQNMTLKNKFYLMSKFSFLFSDKILSNSYSGIEAYRAPKNKTECIYNGLDLSRFVNLKDKQTVLNEILSENILPDRKVIGMVAAFEARKDYSTLLKAAIQICTDNPAVYFILVGGGVLWDDIRAGIPIHLIKNIVLTGKRADIESIVNTFDIGVLLTNSDFHGEGISNSIIEYMALSKPVIATRGGGTNEVVFDNKNGFLIDAYAPDQLMDKIKLLLADQELVSKLGQTGRRMVEENFSLDKMTSSFIKVYSDLS